MGLILVVDEEEDACRLMTRIFRRCGHRVVTFTQGKDALRWLEHHFPDVTVVDVNLRNPQGAAVLDHLKGRTVPARIILVTGRPCPETAKTARDHGIENYLVKPLEIDEMEDRVNRAMRLIL